MLEPRHNEGRGAWLNWFAKEVSLYRGSFRSLYQGLRSLGLGSALWEKGEKSALAKKKIGERSEPRGSLGRGKGWRPFPLPMIPLGSLRSPIFSYLTLFFAFSPHCGARSQAKVFVIEDRYIKVSLYVPGGTTSFPAMK